MSDWPDLEGALRSHLRADAGVQAALGGSRVFFAIPDNPTWPLVTVSRVGGGQSDTSDAPVDAALMSIDVWGEIDPNGRPKKIQATDVVNAVRSALDMVRGRTTFTADVDVFGVTVAGVAYAPDPDNGRPHYAITAEVIGISS